ncbi:MAG: gliding motility-associated C-terminal domain-containing protein [Vicingus serpentipes]|nr:gliding motility-associated C-terminal domain-containing protein [Vicingus serpentipes]
MKATISILFTILSFIQLNGQCVPKSGPLTPIIVDSVTVDSLGNIGICWQASPDPSLLRYYLFRVNTLTGSNDVIDSITPPTNCFTILAANNNSNTTTEEYAIGVRDSCDNTMLTVLDYHNTIFLQSTPNPCTESILLNWNAYNDFQSGLNVLYKIYVRENSGAYVLAGTTNSTSYNYTGVNQGSIYDFYVRGVENGGVGPFSSSSNVISVNTNFFLKNPSFIYSYTATVIDSQQIDLQFYVDTAADAKEYVITRALSAFGNYEAVASVSAYAGMNPMITYSDFSVDANYQSYYYKVNAINSCGDLKLTSNISKTILLKATSDNLKALNTLSFNAYDYWQGGASRYDIYRSVGGIWDPAPIGSTADFLDTTTYTDDVTYLLTGTGEFCYKVIAVENPIGHVANLPAASSSSNESCTKHTPIFFIPNAFAPDGEYNPVFKPILNYLEPSSYSLTIYDRWGHEIFRTEDITEGWNGQFNNSGEKCSSGTYIYLIQYISAEKEEFQQRGKVHLLF